MKQFWWPGKVNGYENLELREVPVPTPGTGEVLVSAADAQVVDALIEVDDEGFTTVVNKRKRASRRTSTGRALGPTNADMDRATEQLFKLYPQCPQADIRSWVRLMKDESAVVAEITKWYAASGLELRDGTKAYAPSRPIPRPSHA